MLKEEFESRINATVDMKTYDLVNFIYANHPSISDTNGKNQVAGLWLNFGITIFKDMYARASRAAELERRKSSLRRYILDCQRRIVKCDELLADLAAGGDLIDNAIFKDAMSEFDEMEEPYFL